jgi:antibiotic biosynthesis monooxygenase (ABM) superfamily enzyme
VVFLWGLLVGTPILTGMMHLDFPLALFIGNAFSVVLTSYLVPWTADRLGWWLNPPKDRRALVNLQGAGLLAMTYAVLILLFWKAL